MVLRMVDGWFGHDTDRHHSWTLRMPPRHLNAKSSGETLCGCVCASVCLCVCASVRLCACASVSVCLADCPSDCLAVRLTVCLPVVLSVCPSVRLPASPSICHGLGCARIQVRGAQGTAPASCTSARSRRESAPSAPGPAQGHTCPTSTYSALLP
eukprot:2817880-Rhodomonas_salina.3